MPTMKTFEDWFMDSKFGATDCPKLEEAWNAAVRAVNNGYDSDNLQEYLEEQGYFKESNNQGV